MNLFPIIQETTRPAAANCDLCMQPAHWRLTQWFPADPPDRGLVITLCDEHEQAAREALQWEPALVRLQPLSETREMTWEDGSHRQAA